MAIVATEIGGEIGCPGGPYRLKNGNPAIKALSWKDVREISEKFRALKPYADDVIPGSVLKIEDDNFDPVTKKQRQIHCLAISAKRYCLFLKDEKGEPEIIRESENNLSNHFSRHGLGHLLNPTDPESDNPAWIATIWKYIIRRALGFPNEKIPFEHLPAIGRVSVSSTAVMRSFAEINTGKSYADQIKPFNFAITCHIQPFGHPIGVNPEHFHLIAPHEKDPRKWLGCDWFDQYSGKKYQISTGDFHISPNTARVKTFADVIQEYEFHAEWKCADAAGNPSNQQTLGLLNRRHVRVGYVERIGKESNCLEEVEAGLEHSAENVYTVYRPVAEWETVIVPATKTISLTVLEKETGLTDRMLRKARNGHTKPHVKNQVIIADAVRRIRMRCRKDAGNRRLSEKDESFL